jgi:hypothetical protein
VLCVDEKSQIQALDRLQKAIAEVLATWNQSPETTCLDRYRRINRRKAIALSPNFGKDSTGMHHTTTPKSETLSCPIIYRTSH